MDKEEAEKVAAERNKKRMVKMQKLRAKGIRKLTKNNPKKEERQWDCGGMVGRNDPCPCGSKLKYKKCNHTENSTWKR